MSYTKTTKLVLANCPHCGSKEVIVQASAVNIEKAFSNVVWTDYESDDGVDYISDLGIDWDSIEIEADFEYTCPECGKVLFYDLDELEKKLRDDPDNFWVEGRKKGK